jgi:hypothetical protein
MEFYKEIGTFDHYSLRNKNVKALSNREKSKIIEMFPFRLPLPNSVDHINPSKIIYDIPMRQYIKALDDKSTRKDIEIYVDDDEYYYVIVYSKGKGIIHHFDVRSYYRCDQWEGLVKLIEEKIIVRVK